MEPKRYRPSMQPYFEATDTKKAQMEIRRISSELERIVKQLDRYKQIVMDTNGMRERSDFNKHIANIDVASYYLSLLELED